MTENVADEGPPKRETALDYEKYPPCRSEDGSFSNGWCYYFKIHFERIFQIYICKIKLLPHEKKKLIDGRIDGEKLGTFSALFTSWRCSLLFTGSMFFSATVAVEAFTLAQYGLRNWEFIRDHAAERYISFFHGLFTASHVLSIGMLVGASFAVIFAWLASYFWTDCNRSQILVRWSFACSFLPPFLLFLVIPFRHSVDFEGIQKQLCRDVLNGTADYGALAESVGLAWPGKVGGLANQLRDMYSLEFPANFCDDDPDTWGDELVSILTSNGYRLNPSTQSCPKAEGSLKLLLSAASTPVVENFVQTVVTEMDRQSVVAVSHAVTQAIGHANLSKNVTDEINTTLLNAIEQTVLNANLTSQIPASVSTVVQDTLTRANVSDNVTSLVSATAITMVQNALLDQLGTSQAATSSSSQIAVAVASAIKLAVANGTSHSLQTSSAASGCPTKCGNCTTSCLPYLHRLSSLSYIFSLNALQNTSSMGKAGLCTHCLSTEIGLQCARNCPEVALAMSREAISGKHSDIAKLCISEEHLSKFSALTEIGTESAYWRMLLGSYFAVVSLSQIMPLLLSLMFGAAKGASISKSVMPCSRVPDLISSCAAVFTFPFLFQFGIVVQNIIGNWITLVAIVLLLTGLFIKMNPRTMTAVGYGQILAISQKLTFARIKKWLTNCYDAEAVLPKLAKACLLCSFVLFIIAFVTSSFISNMTENLKDVGLHFTDEQLDVMREKAIFNFVLLFMTFLGKSLIATVFFADAVCDIMFYFHKNEREDPTLLQFDRVILVDDLATMNQDRTHCNPCKPLLRALGWRQGSLVHPEPHRRRSMKATMKSDLFMKKFIEGVNERFKNDDQVSILIDEIRKKEEFFEELQQLAEEAFANMHDQLVDLATTPDDFSCPNPLSVDSGIGMTTTCSDGHATDDKSNFKVHSILKSSADT